MQVVLSVGASVITGQVITGAAPVPLKAVSLICRPVIVTLPVLLTRNEYATVWPAADTVVGDAVLSSVSAELNVTGVVTPFSQRAWLGQPGSPPPLTLAVLVTDGTAASVGVTGMTKFTAAPTPTGRPAGIVHVTV